MLHIGYLSPSSICKARCKNKQANTQFQFGKENLNLKKFVEYEIFKILKSSL